MFDKIVPSGLVYIIGKKSFKINALMYPYACVFMCVSARECVRARSRMYACFDT